MKNFSAAVILLLTLPAIGRADPHLPSPYTHGAECGLLLPCVPAAQLSRGLAANLRVGFGMESATPELTLGAAHFQSISVSSSWFEAGAWIWAEAQNRVPPGKGTRFAFGPLGIWGLVSPPFLRHLGGHGDHGGVSLAAQAELAIAAPPLDGAGSLYREVESVTALASGEWLRARLLGTAAVGVQLADQGKYRGGQVGVSLSIWASRSLYLGGEVLTRFGTSQKGEVFAGLVIRILEGSGLLGAGAWVWREPLQHGAPPSGWRAFLTTGVSWGRGYDSSWLVPVRTLVLRGLGPPSHRPASLPAQALRLPRPEPFVAGPLCVPSGPITKAMLRGEEELPPPVPALSEVSLRSYRACQFASYAAGGGGGGGGLRPPPRVLRRPCRGTGRARTETWRPEYEVEPWRDPKFKGYESAEDVPLRVWAAPCPLETSIGPARGEAVHTRPATAAPAPPPPRPQAGEPVPSRGEAVHLVPASVPVRGGVAPVRKGQLGQEGYVRDVQAEGRVVPATEVTFQTPHGRRRVDAVEVDPATGETTATEIKTGPNARYKPIQRIKDKDIEEGRAVGVGANAKKAGLEGPVRLKTKVIRRP